RVGMRLMDPRLALAALGQTMDHDLAETVVSDMDWERFAPGYLLARPRPLISDIPEVAALLAEEAASIADVSAGDALRARLAGLTAPEQHTLLSDLIRGHAADVLGHASADAVPGDRPFQELGFDSLTAVDLRNRLNATTGLRLPATLVFDHPNAAILATYLATELVGDQGADSGTKHVLVADPGEPIAIVGMACRLPGDL